jgi:transcription initiation factor TFIIB
MTDRSTKNIDEEVLYSRICTEKRGKETLAVAEAEIARLCCLLGLDDGVETVAKAVYRRTLKTNIIQNRTVAQIATASVVAACRVEGNAYSLGEVLSEAHAEEKYVSRAFSELSQELELSTGPTDPTDFVSRLCTKLDLSSIVRDRAEELIEKTMDSGLHSGQSPLSFAAGGVYAASLLCNEYRTQQEVADAADVSKKTVSIQYRRQLYEVGEYGEYTRP